MWSLSPARHQLPLRSRVPLYQRVQPAGLDTRDITGRPQFGFVDPSSASMSFVGHVAELDEQFASVFKQEESSQLCVCVCLCVGSEVVVLLQLVG